MSSDNEYQQNEENWEFPSTAGQLKKGQEMVINGEPCKILEITTSKTGKHGHAKANITARNLFTGNKAEDSVSTSHNVTRAVIRKVEYDVLAINSDDKEITLVGEDGEEYDFNCNETEAETLEKIQEAFDDGKDVEVSVIKFKEREKIVSFTAKD